MSEYKINELKQAKILLDTVNKMITNKIKNLPYTRMVKGKVLAVNDDGTVNVDIQDNTYENVRVAYGLTVNVDNVVWIIVPNNNMREKFIIDIIS